MAFNKTKALEEAAKLVTQRKISQAIKHYLAISAKDPSDLALLNTIGDLCVRDGNTAEALRQFQKLADAYTREGFTLKAIAICKKIAKLDPQSIDPPLKLAELYASQKLTHESEQQYNQALALCERRGLNEQAGQILVKLLGADPASNARRKQLAGLCERVWRDQAPAPLVEALGKSYLAAGDWAQAQEMFDRLVRRGDHRPELLALLKEAQEENKPAPSPAPAEAPEPRPASDAPQPHGAHSAEVDFAQEFEAFSPPPAATSDPPADANVDTRSTGESAPPATPDATPSGASAPEKSSFEDEFAEVEFYLDYNLLAEGRDALARLALKHPEHARVAALRNRLSALLETEPDRSETLPAGPPSEQPAAPPATDQLAEPLPPEQLQPSATSPPAGSAEEGRSARRRAEKAPEPARWEPATVLFESLTSELAMAMAGVPSVPGTDEAFTEASIDPAELLGESQDAADQTEEALQTHFDLALAFREMGLLDEAIAEFQKASKDPAPPRGEAWNLEACVLLGVCFMEKQMPGLAAQWLARALQSPGLDQKTALTLSYDLATAYERSGNYAAALEKFSEIYGVDAGYRDVAEKVRDLQPKQN